MLFIVLERFPLDNQLWVLLIGSLHYVLITLDQLPEFLLGGHNFQLLEVPKMPIADVHRRVVEPAGLGMELFQPASLFSWKDSNLQGLDRALFGFSFPGLLLVGPV